MDGLPVHTATVPRAPPQQGVWAGRQAEPGPRQIERRFSSQRARIAGGRQPPSVSASPQKGGQRAGTTGDEDKKIVVVVVAVTVMAVRGGNDTLLTGGVTDGDDGAMRMRMRREWK